MFPYVAWDPEIGEEYESTSVQVNLLITVDIYAGLCKITENNEDYYNELGRS
ncbi:MAG: hypothetical protein ACP5N3_06670 [Candidatus Nanoarchaeia archaeon]